MIADYVFLPSDAARYSKNARQANFELCIKAAYNEIQRAAEKGYTSTLFLLGDEYPGVSSDDVVTVLKKVGYDAERDAWGGVRVTWYISDKE